MPSMEVGALEVGHGGNRLMDFVIQRWGSHDGPVQEQGQHCSRRGQALHDAKCCSQR